MHIKGKFKIITIKIIHSIPEMDLLLITVGYFIA